MQVKRIHDYKRQLLNVLGIIWRYDSIKKMTPEQRKQVGHCTPRLLSPWPSVMPLRQRHFACEIGLYGPLLSHVLANRQ